MSPIVLIQTIDITSSSPNITLELAKEHQYNKNIESVLDNSFEHQSPIYTEKKRWRSSEESHLQEDTLLKPHENQFHTQCYEENNVKNSIKKKQQTPERFLKLNQAQPI